MGTDNWDRINSGYSKLESALQEEVVRLENVISTLRDMLIAAGVSERIIDDVEDEAYNRELEYRG